MSWDIKYRPSTYGEVLGQEATIRILRQTVKSGKGFHQSYLLHGPYGDGKTTLARILGRALLCDSSVDGSPCDECHSCKELLRTGSSECFMEVDAATNSGKESIRRILETIEFSSFSGKRRIYLFDESHQLSKDALDALLKPMEDARESGDRRLVCIFCTTEPERMQNTVGSRCGPSFAIRVVTPQIIAQRLEWICSQEKISYESEALVRIAEGVESHIRDAIKSCEMLARQGMIDVNSVRMYLGQDLNDLYLEVIQHLGGDIGCAIAAVKDLLVRESPSVVYQKLASICLLSYKVGLGICNPPSYWDSRRLQQVGLQYKESLLIFAELFSTRPRRPTKDMLHCDILSVHRRLSIGIPLEQGLVQTLVGDIPNALSKLHPSAVSRLEDSGARVVPLPVRSIVNAKLHPTVTSSKNYLTPGGTYVPPNAVSQSRREALEALRVKESFPQGLRKQSSGLADTVEDCKLSAQCFSLLTLLRTQELLGEVLNAKAFNLLMSRLLLELDPMSMVDRFDKRKGNPRVEEANG